MRRWVAASLLVLAPATLSGCGPYRTAVVGVGLNVAGELVAAVATCDAEELSDASLWTDGDEPVELGRWSRSSPLLGDEAWRLRDSSGSPWTAVGAPLPELQEQVSYTFGLRSDDGGEQSNWITFTGADLDRLTPGHVLVDRYGPVDAKGEADISLTVIDVDDLPDEHCGY